MHHPRPLLALLALALLPAAVGSAARAEPMVAAPRSVPAASALAGAHLLGRQASDAPISAALTLPLRNQAALDTLLHRLYTPGDPLFGHYLTPAQFDAQFGPTPADYDAVTSYLRAQGLTVHPYASRTLVDVSGTSAGVESAFHVHLNRYQTASGRVAYANDAAPLLPASIAARIGGVVGLDNLIVPHSHLVKRRPTSILSTPIGNGPGGGLSPSDINRLYNLDARSGVQLAGEGQSLGLLELDGYDTGDIRQYITQFGLPIDPNNTDILVNEPTPDFSGPSGTSNEGEVVLDIDMMLAVAPRVNHIYVYETDDSKTIGILQLLTNIASDDFAQSISCSWGLAEDIIALQESSSQYTTLLNAENAQLQKMSVQGQSFFDAAGDAGAYADEPDLGSAATISVQDPGCQPYATTVGGTTLNAVNPNTTTIAYGSETTWNDGAGDAGGGGFSSFFLKPFYQYSSGSTSNPTDPVGATGGTYGLVPGLLPTFLPSTPRRDLPDVSLNADPQTGYTIFVGLDGTPSEVDGGTSAAAPLWAAFTALANEARAADALGVNPGVSPGLPRTPVGFINPLIYQIGYGQYGSYASDFHDIDDGSNNLVYRAGVGFDDATGWGSFNGANLLRDLAAKAPNSTSGATGGTQTTVFSGTFPPGFQMISVPEQFPAGDTFAQVFGLNTLPVNGPMLFQWQPSTQTYANSNTVGSAADMLVPGQGYWLYVPTYDSPGLSLALTGATPTAPLPVTLQAGWNQIGDPFAMAEPLSNVAVALSSGTGAPPPPPAPGTPGAPTLANSPSLVYGTLYTYPAGAGQYTAITAQQGGAALQPYAGYWVYAFQPVTLTFQ